MQIRRRFAEALLLQLLWCNHGNPIRRGFGGLLIVISACLPCQKRTAEPTCPEIESRANRELLACLALASSLCRFSFCLRGNIDDDTPTVAAAFSTCAM